MTDATHFHNFAPADAVQYDGTQQSGSLAIGWLRSDRDRIYEFYRYARNARLEAFVIEENGDVYLCPGQWLVRPVGDTRVWVQDEEPARVERWESEVRTDAQHGKAFVHHHRPVVRTPDGSLWSGPWSPVEGGAE